MSAREGERSPLDGFEWPSKLAAHVVSPGPRPTIHGYDVEDDLATSYSFAEVVLLALTGEPPSREAGKAFEVAMIFASPVTVAEAPAHAAVVARACASSPSQLAGVAAIALGEQTRVLLEEHRGWLEVLSGGANGDLPGPCRAGDDEDRAAVARLRRALVGTVDVPALALDLSRAAALLATLHACGLRTADRIECALTWARLPLALAEALATSPGSHLAYPLKLPAIVYGEDPANRRDAAPRDARDAP